MTSRDEPQPAPRAPGPAPGDDGATLLVQLEALVRGLPVGVTVFDEQLRLLFWNDLILDILGLPAEAVYRSVPFGDLIRYPAERGEYGPGDPAALVAQRVELARRFEPHRFERAARDGRTLRVDGYPYRVGGRIAGFVTTYTDITERKRAEAELARQRDALRTIIDHFPGAVSVFDAQLRLVDFNPAFGELLDLPDELLRREVVRFEDLIRYNARRGEYGPGDPEAYVGATLARARDFAPHTLERTRPNGRTLQVIGQPLPGGGFVTLYVDITERKRAEERMRAMALTDSLTGLANRARLYDEIAAARRRHDETGMGFALLFLDLDGFKGVNDSLGHDAGDALLRAVAARLVACLRAQDLLVRLGGDEFVVLVRELQAPGAARALADAVVAAVAAPVALPAGTAQVRASLGLAWCPAHGSDREALLRAADRAMYAAKTAGGGAWREAPLDVQRPPERA